MLVRETPDEHPKASKPKYTALHMKLEGSRPWDDPIGLEPTGGVSNYFLGNDPKAWRTNIPQFARISAPGVYDGIDLVFYGQGSDLEYDFVVKPSANPKQILTTAGSSELRQIRPKVYQQLGDKRVEVAGGYKLQRPLDSSSVRKN
jgi:hypothetical protein